MSIDFLPAAHSGDTLKAAGQKAASKTAGPAWTQDALAALREFLAMQRAGALFTFDGFRTWAEGFLDQPASVNAWGSLPRSAMAQKLIAPTGHTQKAARGAAHSRVVRVWAVA